MTNYFSLFVATLMICFLVDTESSDAQKVFNDKRAYEQAKIQYNYQLASWSNYIRKRNYFLSSKFSLSNRYSSFEEFWDVLIFPDFKRLGIYADNEEERFLAKAIPWRMVHINFLEVPGLNFYKVTITDDPLEEYEYVYSAKTYCFAHPGSPPVYKPAKQQVRKSTAARKVVATDPVVNQVQTITPSPEPVEVKPQYFIMPDGNKYKLYEDLICGYPMMANAKVFKNAFQY